MQPLDQLIDHYRERNHLVLDPNDRWTCCGWEQSADLNGGLVDWSLSCLHDRSLLPLLFPGAPYNLFGLLQCLMEHFATTTNEKKEVILIYHSEGKICYRYSYPHTIYMSDGYIQTQTIFSYTFYPVVMRRLPVLKEKKSLRIKEANHVSTCGLLHSIRPGLTQL